jgi:hypothetical protein
LTTQTSAPDIFQEEAGAQSAPDRVSGDSNSSESVVPVYSGEGISRSIPIKDMFLEAILALTLKRVLRV